MAKNKKKKKTLAQRADRHELYQESVQDSEFELDFVQDTYKGIRKRKPVTLREDFAGTSRSACVWVKRNKNNQAWAVDFDEEVLEWGRKHNYDKLKPKQRERVEFIQSDVRTVKTPSVDVVLAAHSTQVEKHKLDGFSYHWDQHSYNALTQEMQCYIHFRFPDKSRLDKAFSYSWRLWGGQETEDLLMEAGFSKVRFFVQMFDEDSGEALDEFEETREVVDHECWIAYIVAEK